MPVYKYAGVNINKCHTSCVGSRYISIIFFPSAERGVFERNALRGVSRGSQVPHPGEPARGVCRWVLPGRAGQDDVYGMSVRRQVSGQDGVSGRLSGWLVQHLRRDVLYGTSPSQS